MADTKITALAAITTVAPANDLLPIVDVDDHSMAASGTTKNITVNQILGAGGTATLASATITGDLTVATNGLKVDSANKNVGINTATPTNTVGYKTLEIVGTGVNTAGMLRFKSSDTSVNTLDFADINGRAIFAISNHPVRFGCNDIEQYRINSLGVFTWYDGAGGTRMTLNSTGLGVGMSPSASLSVLKSSATQATGLILRNANGADGSSISLDFETSAGTSGTEGSLAGRISGRRVGGGTTGALDFFVNNGGTLGTAKMTLDASGNLLVGTASALQLSNNASVTSRIANLGSGSKGAAILRENEVSQYWGGSLYLQKVRGASTAVQSGDSLGVVGFGGFDGTNYVNTGIIQTLVTGAVSAGVVPVKIQVIATSGGVELTNTATAWAAISDERLKDIIEPISNAVTKVGLLRSVIGKYKTDSEGTRRSFLIAQDVKSAIPEAVGGDDDNMTVRYTEVIPLLVAAIKELTARVQTLETR